MRVAVDANALAWGWGGIPKYVDRLARELAAIDGVELTLLGNTRAPIASIAGTREVVCRRRTGVLWRNGFVAPWLAAERPDVFWAAETLVPWRVPVPAVVTVHDVASLRLDGIKPPAQRLAYRTSTRRGVRAATRVIAVSRATAADAERLLGADPARVRVVPLGIDDAYVPGDRAAAQEAVAAGSGSTARSCSPRARSSRARGSTRSSPPRATCRCGSCSPAVPATAPSRCSPPRPRPA